jgi:hypothetical protein
MSPEEGKATMTMDVVLPQPATKLLTCDEALRIAREDAEKVYHDLARFHISLFLEPDGWHIEYRGSKPFVAGGGPHYVVDAVAGAIVSKKYYQ